MLESFRKCLENEKIAESQGKKMLKEQHYFDVMTI